MLACMRVHIVMCDCVDCRGLHGILFHGLSMGYPSMDCRGLHGIPFPSTKMLDGNDDAQIGFITIYIS